VSRALTKLTQCLGLHDVWDSSSGRIDYTHFTHAGANRIDRIYGTEDILARKQGAETIATAFTDHLAVIVRVTYNVPSTTRKHWAWRMDPVLIGDIDFRGNRRCYGAGGGQRSASTLTASNGGSDM
jgi:hypothetical protein